MPSARDRLRVLANDRGGLPEQDPALLLRIDAWCGAQLGADLAPLLYRRSLAHRLLEVALEVGEIVHVLAEVLEAHQPRPDREVGDRNGARHELVVGKPFVENAEQAIHFVTVAILAILQRLDRIELRR